MKFTTCVLLLALAMFSSAASAEVIVQIDLAGGSAYTGAVPADTDTTAGDHTPPSNGNTWNVNPSSNQNGTTIGSPLTESAGTSTVNWSFSVDSSYEGNAADDRLNDHFTAPNTNNTTLIDWSLSGLGPTKTYDLYFRSQWLNQGGQWQVGTTTVANSETAFDWVKMANVAPDSSGNIIGLWGANDPGSGNPDGYGTWSAMSIVEVPEPATMSLLAVGGLACLLKRKRKV